LYSKKCEMNQVWTLYGLQSDNKFNSAVGYVTSYHTRVFILTTL